MNADDAGMTLAFTLAALRRLADPADAVSDAGRWSAGVGVVADDRDALDAYLEREGVAPDFVSGEKGVVGGLVAVRQRVRTDRHVVVGTSDDARSAAEAVGWEYVDVGEAASKAGWPLADEE